MAGIRAILRDAPAGQLARLFLGLKISPYADEQEGYVFSAPPHAKDDLSSNSSHDSDKDDASEQDAENKETGDESSDRDVEVHAANEASHAQAMGDPNAVEWSGPNDPDNPQNWSTLKKTFVFAQICLLTFASKCLFAILPLSTEVLEDLCLQPTVYSASAIITPAQPVFQEIFGLNTQVSSLTLSMYVLGYVSFP
jgi:DHA1 family multidrug resistance protein-like MFS transporter